MPHITKELVLHALESLPQLKGNISAITVREGEIGFILENRDHLPKEKLLQLQGQAENILYALPGVSKVMAILTEDITVDPPAAPFTPKPPSPTTIPGVKNIILVASGKGGVGKSTIAANLAVSLANKGYKTGLVDADIHGPSIARMMGMKEEPPVKDGKIMPAMHHKVKCLSMGTFLGEDVPVVWRGPMVTKALGRFLKGADWETLDYMVIDMPPGTGDIHISLAQNVTANGVILVSTPQEVALLDVRKAISLYQKLSISVLGLVENMAFIELPDGSKHYPFGKGAVEALCQKIGITYLGALPILPEISEGGDKGTPVMTNEKPTAISKLFDSLIETMEAAVSHP